MTLIKRYIIGVDRPGTSDLDATIEVETVPDGVLLEVKPGGQTAQYDDLTYILTSSDVIELAAALRVANGGGTPGDLQALGEAG